MADKITGTKDAIRMLSEGLRRAAFSPNILSYTPHEKQRQFHSSPAKGRQYIGGNRSGKTTGGVVEDIWYAMGAHPYIKTPLPPCRIRIISVDFVNGIQKIILPQLAQWTPLSALKGGSWTKAYSKENRILSFENESFIELMSYDQDLDKFAGTSRHLIHFDEECPQDIFTENKARLIDTGGSWIMTMTPVEGLTWTYDEIYVPGTKGGDPNIDVIEADMTDNPHLNDAEIDQFLSGLNRDERKARKEGKYVQIGGLVYKTFSKEKHVVESFVPPLDWEWYVSLDHGYNNPTAVLWHAVSPDGNVITFSEHYEAERTVEYHANTIHLRNAAFGREPDMYICDPSLSQRNGVTGTSIADEYAKLEIPFLPSNNDVVAGVARVNHFLSGNEPRWHVTENCKSLIWEMERLRWKTWANKRSALQNNKHDVIHKKDDHAADSLRYFFMATPELAGEGLTAEPDIIRPFPIVGASEPASNVDWQLSRRFIDRSPEGGIDETVGIW